MAVDHGREDQQGATARQARSGCARRDGRYELVDFASFSRQFPMDQPMELEAGEETRGEAAELEV